MMQKYSLIALAALGFVGLTALLLNYRLNDTVPTMPVVDANAPPPPQFLQSQDLKLGTGAVAQSGQQVSVHYSGWLYDGTHPDHKGKAFDSSRDLGQAIIFLIGAGDVIRGWEQGIVGMRVGGVRRLIIPPALAYGDKSAAGVIPPNATLVFEVELMEVRPGP